MEETEDKMLMDTIVLTTCSASHLGAAKNMCDSVLRHNPGYKCFIGLVDRIDGRFDPQRFAPHTIIEAHTIGLAEFGEMTDRYNVFELSCAMKSFFAAYLLETYKPGCLIYFDTDIMIFHSLQLVEKELESASFLITPHTSRLFPSDGQLPGDRDLLRTGIYNSGFYAMKDDENTRAILRWLNSKMVTQCRDDPADGLFVDQKWFNLVPAYFNGVKQVTHPGFNAAYWNLHERQVQQEGAHFTVNGQPLIFFHFSGYSLDLPERVSRHQGRISLQQTPALPHLFRIYHDALISAGHRELLSLAYSYKKESFSKKLKRMLKGR